MKDLLKQAFANPLAPFILILTLIILLTVIVSNLRDLGKNASQRNNALDEKRMFSPELQYYQRESDPAKSAEEEKAFIPENIIRDLNAEAVYDWNQGDYAAAEDKFKTVLLFQSSNPLALSHLGLLYLRKEDYPAAEFMFRNLTLYYPYNTANYLQLAHALMKQDKIKEALEAARRALFFDSNSPAALIALARIYTKTKRYEAACEYLNRAVRAHPDAILQIREDSDLSPLRKTMEYKAFLAGLPKSAGGEDK